MRGWAAAGLVVPGAVRCHEVEWEGWGEFTRQQFASSDSQDCLGTGDGKRSGAASPLLQLSAVCIGSRQCWCQPPCPLRSPHHLPDMPQAQVTLRAPKDAYYLDFVFT